MIDLYTVSILPLPLLLEGITTLKVFHINGDLSNDTQYYTTFASIIRNNPGITHYSLLSNPARCYITAEIADLIATALCTLHNLEECTTWVFNVNILTTIIINNPRLKKLIAHSYYHSREQCLKYSLYDAEVNLKKLTESLPQLKFTINGKSTFVAGSIYYKYP